MIRLGRPLIGDAPIPGGLVVNRTDAMLRATRAPIICHDCDEPNHPHETDEKMSEDLKQLIVAVKAMLGEAIDTARDEGLDDATEHLYEALRACDEVSE